MNVLVIDNYDSFTYNLVQYLGELGAESEVIRNDVLSVEAILAKRPARILLSPGPCTPNEAGVCLALIEAAKGQIPILGVCLGHQAIGQAFGGLVVRAPRLMHGKTSPIHHSNEGVFRGLPVPTTATRYHSLVVSREQFPESLTVTAWADDGQSVSTIMGIRHKNLPIEGVQFHPESILSTDGKHLLANWLEQTQ